MGRVYTFTCPKCEYRARVSGGVEEGLHCVTRTIVCRNCKALHDVAVRVRIPEAEIPPSAKKKLLPPKTDFLPPMLLFGQPPRTKWLTMKLGCPVAEFHAIEEWATPGKCPRCGLIMERDILPYRIWD